jgi:hypothetical protein
MFQKSNKLFFTMVCKYLAAWNYSAPSWTDWLDIRGTALGGKRIDAIKMLRGDCVREMVVEVEIPKGVTHPGGEFSVFVCEQGRRVVSQTLPLVEAKAIIDWLCGNEEVFGPSEQEGPATAGELIAEKFCV